MSGEISVWYKDATLDQEAGCSHDTRCMDATPDGNCDSCNTLEGRWIEAVCEYASTCDECGELTHHDEQTMDPITQLGYCRECVPKQPEEIRKRLEAVIDETCEGPDY